MPNTLKGPSLGVEYADAFLCTQPDFAVWSFGDRHDLIAAGIQRIGLNLSGAGINATDTLSISAHPQIL